ncbi:hypothetical protein K501DRAFT_156144, partial [Backusella circina FSU 941]
SIELEHLYHYAKEEINYAQESQGSIYYEGDQQSAYDALAACENKYDIILQQLQNGYSMMAVMQFKSKWEAELFQLRVQINSLP